MFLPLYFDVEDGRFVAGAVALFAWEFDVGEELHFDGDSPVAFADITATTGYVEGECAGRVVFCV